MTVALVAGVIACWGAALVVVVVMLHRAHTALAPSPRPPASERTYGAHPAPVPAWHRHALTQHCEVCLEDTCTYEPAWDVPTDLRVTT